MLIYFGMRYDDARVGGQRYVQEWFFSYELGLSIAANATQDEAARMGPYVEEAWGEW
jgi:hypothetical protein